MPFTPGERARAAGRQGVDARARARAERKASKLSLFNVEAQLPPLTSLEDAKARLDRIGTWAVAGLLPGSVAMAAVRSCEVWLKACEAELTQEVAQRLRHRVEELEAELQRSRVGISR